MVKKAAILLNHRLTDYQKKELRQIWSVTELVFPTANIAGLWKSVPPVGDISIPLSETLIKWLQNVTVPYDYIVIQGDYGMVCLLVQWCFCNQRIPLYATSQRKAVEAKENGKIVTRRIFDHVNFRRYSKLNWK